jgi:hypothetical protein
MNIHDAQTHWYPLDATFGNRNIPDGCGIPALGATRDGDGDSIAERGEEWFLSDDGDGNSEGWIGTTEFCGDGAGGGDYGYVIDTQSGDGECRETSQQ